MAAGGLRDKSRPRMISSLTCMTYASLQIKSFSTLTSNYLQAKQRLDDQPVLLVLLSTGTLSRSWDQSRSTLYTALCSGLVAALLATEG